MEGICLKVICGYLRLNPAKKPNPEDARMFCTSSALAASSASHPE